MLPTVYNDTNICYKYIHAIVVHVLASSSAGASEPTKLNPALGLAHTVDALVPKVVKTR